MGILPGAIAKSASDRPPAPPSPLLETKTFLPRARRRAVPRPRLLDLLDTGSDAALTLVSAPAGFGKSTLLAAWLAGRRGASAGAGSAAWVSLDAGDNDPALFWTYVITALRTVAPTVGTGALALLETGTPATQPVLTALLNDVASIDRDIVLVLDDYHVMESREVHDGMAFLLDHAPAGLHVVLASRADPPLPLARLRARGELREVRAADLRFTAAEASAYLIESMELPLTAGDVAALGSRTEGWIAALQLAALSMQGRDDLAGFVADFAGDDRYIVDYLVEEVLERQPEDVRTFLLQTSILARMDAALCDAVTGRADGRAALEALDRANLFLVPLDDRRRWYRYHHLFAEVLQSRLLLERQDEVAGLHRRASAWHARHGEPDAAIRHALAAGDHPMAADLIEAAVPAMSRARREVALRGWLEALPVELFRDRPVLSLAFAGALLSTGQVDGVEQRLRDAERWVETDAPGPVGQDAEATEPIVVDATEQRRLPASVAVYRSGLALARGDAAATVHFARRALDLVEDDDLVRRGAASALLGLALWGSGDLEAAHDGYAESSASFRRSGYISDVLGCAITLADIRMVQGRLGDALSTYEEALQLALEQPAPGLRGIADMHVGISTVLLERGELEGAAEHLRLSEQLGEQGGLPKHPYRWREATAHLRAAEGDVAAAVALLDQADRVFVTDMAPNLRPIPAVRARAWLAQGRVAEALGWARAQRLSADDDLTFLREFEHVTLARILLAQHRTQRDSASLGRAVALLGRLGDAAEGGGRTGTLIEILVLQAIAQQARGDIPAALVPLERALSLAEPGGHVRVFVDEGPPMAALLDAVARRGPAADHMARVRSGFRQDSPPARPGEPRTALPDPLSPREREVLRLLDTELSGPEIARRLVVSLNTVRTHTKSIYVKLGVTSRRSAVLRARETGQLDGGRGRPD